MTVHVARRPDDNSSSSTDLATLACMKHCCWAGHLFASNVGVLPTVPDGCILDPRIVLSVPSKDFGTRLKKRQRRLRHALTHDCCPNETNDVAPTVDVRTQRR